MTVVFDKPRADVPDVLAELRTDPRVTVTTVDAWTSLCESAGLFMPVTVTEAAWIDAGMDDKTRRFAVLLAANRAGHRNDGDDHTLFTIPGTPTHRPSLLVLSVTDAQAFTISLFGEGAE